MSPNESRIFRTSIIVFYAILGLLAIGFALTPYRLWAINTYGFLPWPWLALALLTGLTVSSLLQRWVHSSRHATAGRSISYWQAAGVVIVLSLIIWYLLRSHAHFLSDGYIILTRLVTDDPPLRPWQKPAFAVLDFLASLTGNRVQGGALVAYEVMAFISGLLVLIGAAWASFRLFDRMRPRIAFLLGLALGGYALLFFGFVSNFVLFTAMAALFCLCGLLAVRQLLSPWWSLIPLAIAGWLHPLAITLIPAMIYVLAQATPLGPWAAEKGRRVTQIALGAAALALVAAIYYGYTSDYFVRFLFVPFLPDRFTVEGYWLLSGRHILDFLNLLLEITPVLPLLIIVWLWRSELPYERVTAHYFCWLALPPLVAAFLVDPKLGMPRDWDMFAFAGLPLTIAFFYRLATADTPSHPKAGVAILGLALSALMLIPRVAVQDSPEAAIAMFDSHSNLDFQKNSSGRYVLLKYLEERGGFDDIRMRTSEYAERSQYEAANRGAQGLMRDGQDTEAAEAFRAVLRDAPAFANAWTNLGLCQYRLEQYDSAVVNLQIADALNPCSPALLNNLALAYYKAGHEDLAEETWLRMLDYDPYNTDAFSWLVVIYELTERPNDRAAMEKRLIEVAGRTDAPGSLIARAAKLYFDRQDITRAREEYRRALDHGYDTAQMLHMQRLFPQLEVIPDDDLGK